MFLSSPLPFPAPLLLLRYSIYANTRYKEDGFKYVAAVGKLKANAYGLHDMIGNVWEWCSDWCSGWYEDYPAEEVDPQGAKGSSYRVQRGGSWSDSWLWFLRSADRSGHSPGVRNDILGARVVFVEGASR